MGDFQLTPPTLGTGGYRPPANLLGDYQLTLDSTLQQAMDKLIAEGEMHAGITNLWTEPRWWLLGTPLPADAKGPLSMRFSEGKPSAIGKGAPPAPNVGAFGNIKGLTPPGMPALKPTGPFANGVPTLAPQKPLFEPGAGPDTPRLGTAGDVLSALYGIPIVKLTAERHLKLVGQYFAAESKPVQVTQITAGVTFLLAGYLAQGKGPYSYISGQDISVPGLDGLSVKFDYTGRGAGFSWANIGGSPFSLEAEGKLGQHGGAAERTGSMMLTSDLTKVVPGLK